MDANEPFPFEVFFEVPKEQLIPFESIIEPMVFEFEIDKRAPGYFKFMPWLYIVPPGLGPAQRITHRLNLPEQSGQDTETHNHMEYIFDGILASDIGRAGLVIKILWKPKREDLAWTRMWTYESNTFYIG